MVLFPVWLLKVLVIGGITLCGVGAAALIVFLIIDSKQKRIW